MKEYKYFKNVTKEAIFTEKKCQFCNSQKDCLEGVYFEQNGITSVCLDCLDNRMVGVNIPGYIQEKIKTDIENKTSELRYTPPVPWVQYNEWPVCCDDYMQYIGEWKQEDFVQQGGNEKQGMTLFESLLTEETRNKADEMKALWNSLEYDTVAFVFVCKNCGKMAVVCQTY